MAGIFSIPFFIHILILESSTYKKSRPRRTAPITHIAIYLLICTQLIIPDDFMRLLLQVQIQEL